MPTLIIYLIGLAGSGKLTIAKVLQKDIFKLVDNHLINNPILSLLDLDGKTSISEEAWDYIGRIRQTVFDFIKTDTFHNFIFNNELLEGGQYDREVYQAVESIALSRKSAFFPIRLLITPEERGRRIISEDRKMRLKTVNREDIYKNKSVMELSHPHTLTLDVSDLSPLQAAQKIQEHIDSKMNDFVLQIGGKH